MIPEHLMWIRVRVGSTEMGNVLLLEGWNGSGSLWGSEPLEHRPTNLRLCYLLEQIVLMRSLGCGCWDTDTQIIHKLRITNDTWNNALGGTLRTKVGVSCGKETKKVSHASTGWRWKE